MADAMRLRSASCIDPAMDYFILAGQGLVLLFLELVLVVDNALVIVLMCRGLPDEKRRLGERIAIGQGAALRVVLIGLMGILMELETPVPVLSEWLVGINGHSFTWTGMIQVVGGFVLIGMSAHHISEEWKPVHHKEVKAARSIVAVLSKTFFVSLIFSVDSVMSAVGSVDNLYVAGGAVALAALVMIFFVGQLSTIMAEYPDLKTLGLAFVFFIGGVLVAEGFGYHVPKVLIYVTLFFGLIIQGVDILRRRARGPIGLERADARSVLLAQMSVHDLQQALQEKAGIRPPHNA